jgi:vesicle-fusing ATPase
VSTSPGQCFVFTVKSHRNVLPSTIGFSFLQRKWATLSLGQDIDVRPFEFDFNKETLATIILEVDFHDKKRLVSSLDP